jgi:polyisoprenoid-binding protein YceI
MPDPRRLHFLTLLLLASLSSPMPAAAKMEDFALDPVHTRVAFQVSHAGLSNPIGTFSGTTGTLSFDEDDWTTAQLTVKLAITTLDLGDANWQERILDPTFFNSAKFPEARFVSSKVERTGEHTAQVTGELTMHGVTHPITLAVTLNALKRHPLTFKRTAGFSATATLSRKDFGMDAWSSLVGDEVRLIIEAEAAPGGKQADAEPEPGSMPTPSTEPDDAASK